MKKAYKEMFDEIRVDDNIVEEVLEKSKEKTLVKYVVLAACFVLLVFAGAGVFENKSHKEISRTGVMSTEYAQAVRVEQETAKRITRGLKCGEKMVKIDADVVVDGHVDDMRVYSASYRIFSAEKFSEILLGEGGMFKGNKEDASIGIPLGSGINFGVYNYLSAENNPISKGDGYAKGCEISYEEAEKIADSFLEAEGSTDYVFVRGEICEPITYGSESAPMGYYEFRYIQYADGFPVESVTSEVYAGTASELTVQVDDRGIIFVRMSGLDLSERAEPEKIIMLEEAIDIVEKSLGELWLSEYAPIIEIRFEYLLDEDENGKMKLFPCWHFCIDKTQLLTLPVDVQRENDTNDLCMNAVTGEMFRTMERYPAFQTAE